MYFLESRFYFFPHKSDPIRFELINVHMLKVFFFVLDKRSRDYHLVRKKLFPEKQACFSMSVTSQHPMQSSVMVARLIMDPNWEQETKEGV